MKKMMQKLIVPIMLVACFGVFVFAGVLPKLVQADAEVAEDAVEKQDICFLIADDDVITDVFNGEGESKDVVKVVHLPGIDNEKFPNFAEIFNKIGMDPNENPEDYAYYFGY